MVHACTAVLTANTETSLLCCHSPYAARLACRHQKKFTTRQNKTDGARQLGCPETPTRFKLVDRKNVQVGADSASTIVTGWSLWTSTFR
jgi:hypothetical protein